MHSYEVRYTYVDDSYWDEGNRTTSGIIHLTGDDHLDRWLDTALNNGFEVSGQQGPVYLKFTLEDLPTRIKITKKETTTIQWYTLPRFKEHAEAEFRRQFRKCITFGEDPTSVKKEAATILGITSLKVHQIWLEEVKKAAEELLRSP